jgi:hypothetical protein
LSDGGQTRAPLGATLNLAEWNATGGLASLPIDRPS